MKIYIAGKYTGDPQATEKFRHYQNLIQRMFPQATVITPIDFVPSSTNWSEAILMCLQMIATVDLVVMLPDWVRSRGARIEREFAEGLNKRILYV